MACSVPSISFVSATKLGTVPGTGVRRFKPSIVHSRLELLGYFIMGGTLACLYTRCMSHVPCQVLWETETCAWRLKGSTFQGDISEGWESSIAQSGNWTMIQTQQKTPLIPQKFWKRNGSLELFQTEARGLGLNTQYWPIIACELQSKRGVTFNKQKNLSERNYPPLSGWSRLETVPMKQWWTLWESEPLTIEVWAWQCSQHYHSQHYHYVCAWQCSRWIPEALRLAYNRLLLGWPCGVVGPTEPISCRITLATPDVLLLGALCVPGPGRILGVIFRVV